MDNKNYGEIKNLVEPRFAKKVNVALAIIAILLLAQGILMPVIRNEELPYLYIQLALLFAAVIYFILCLNGYLERVIIYDEGIRVRNIFKDVFLNNKDIKKVEIKRKVALAVLILIEVEGGAIKIYPKRYKDVEPLLDFAKTVR